MARRASVPVVPVVVDGTGDALPKHGLALRPRPPRHFHVKILPPMMPDSSPDAATFAKTIRETMKRELVRMRGEETTAT